MRYRSHDIRQAKAEMYVCPVILSLLALIHLTVEYDPLFPAETHIYLTTNPETVANSSKLDLGMNVHANDRYFDRPEVVKAYREQEIIQTPEFVAVPVETPGRLRPRNSEEVRSYSNVLHS